MQNMNIPEHNLQLMILSQDEAQELVARQPGHWQIISIWGKLDGSPADFGRATRILHLGFDDVTADDAEEGFVAATEADIVRALEFTRQAWPGPLLIHCHAGVSRSPALAWVVLWDRLGATIPAAQEALDIVHRVRPDIEPNPHIMRLGVMHLCGNPAAEKQIWAKVEAMRRAMLFPGGPPQASV